MKKIMLFSAFFIASLSSFTKSVQTSDYCMTENEALESELQCDTNESDACPSAQITGNYVFTHKGACLVLSAYEYQTIAALLEPRKNTGSNALLKDILQAQKSVLAKGIKRRAEKIKALKTTVTVLEAIVDIAPAQTVGGFFKQTKKEYQQ